MSKYRQRGPYHFVEFVDETTVYHRHVNNLLFHVGRHLPPKQGHYIHEVGCGEGLIVHHLSRMGYRVSGNDADPAAVKMANFLMDHPIRCEADITKHGSIDADGILFADSLEHIEQWEEHLRWAKLSARVVFIAVPDRHDRHGLRDFTLTSFDPIFADWKKVEAQTANHRHLLIFTRWP